MATGHLNPGYNRIVTKFSSAINNPTGEKRPLEVNRADLDAIRAKSREVWSMKDNSETTYGFYFGEPLIKEKTNLRPTSPTRRNNPHPNRVFLTSHMRTIPGYFNDEDRELVPGYSSSSSNQSSSNYVSQASSRSQSAKPGVSVYRNPRQYIDSLPNEVAQQEEERLKGMGIDTNYQTAPRGENVTYLRESEHDRNSPNCRIQCKRETQLQTNALNPYLYDDMRVYREKYATGDHGLPNPNGKKPFRGDFMMHPDWHAKIKHHQLPYDI